MSEKMPERMSEDMSDRMSEDMPDRMPEKMSEDMSDRMPEDLPVRKCINVMWGITRSKVIVFSGSTIDSPVRPSQKTQYISRNAQVSETPAARSKRLAGKSLQEITSDGDFTV